MKTKQAAEEEYLQSKKWAEGDPAKWVQRTFIARVEFAQRWIPVQEELPPINEAVLLKTDFNFIVGFYTGSNKFRALTFSCLGVKNVEINNITHWRPIEYK